jgi:GTP1/Obg family GTP-binding protein
MQVFKSGKGYTVDIKTSDMHIIAYLMSKDEVHEVLQRLPNLQNVLQYIEHLADDVITGIEDYNRAVKFLRGYIKMACRVLLCDRGFYSLEPINM